MGSSSLRSSKVKSACVRPSLINFAPTSLNVSDFFRRCEDSSAFLPSVVLPASHSAFDEEWLMAQSVLLFDILLLLLCSKRLIQLNAISKLCLKLKVGTVPTQKTLSRQMFNVTQKKSNCRSSLLVQEPKNIFKHCDKLNFERLSPSESCCGTLAFVFRLSSTTRKKKKKKKRNWKNSKSTFWFLLSLLRNVFCVSHSTLGTTQNTIVIGQVNDG